MYALLTCILASKVQNLAHLLARWHAKLKNWHAFGTLAHLLADWPVKTRNCYTFRTLARWYVGHTGTHGMHGNRFSKLNLFV